MMQIVLANVKVEIAMSDTHKVLQFTDVDSKIVIVVPLDRLSAAQVGRQLAGDGLAVAGNGGSNGH